MITTVNTPVEAAFAPTKIIKNLDQGAVNVFLLELLKWTNDQLNIPPMTYAQAYEAVRLIREDKDYKMFRPEDFKLCFETGVKGEYGKLYGRLDVNILFEWLKGYSLDRERDIIQYNKDKAIKRAEETNTRPLVDPKAFGELADKLSKPKPVIQKKPPVKNEANERVKKLFKEFEDIYQKDGEEMGNMRFIKYKGKRLTQSDYINIRIEEMISE